jgi:hypothetical protein
MRSGRRLLVAGHIALFVIIAFLAATAVFAQTDPLIGTWKLDPAKSKYTGAPPIKSQTVTYAAVPNGLRTTVTGVDGTGKKMAYGYTAYFDGKDYSEPGVGQPNGMDTINIRRVDSNTTEYTGKKGGKVVQTARRVVSNGGKTLTITTTGTDDKGQKTATVTVYDKQ